jgi:hypothetical protein
MADDGSTTSITPDQPTGTDITPRGDNMSREDWSKFFGDLTTSVKSGNQELATRLDSIRTTVTPPPTSTPEPSADELDGMSNSEFGNFLMGRMERFIKDTFSEGVKPLANGISDLRRDYTISSATAELNTLRGSNKDLDDWNSEMVSLATEHPTLSIPQLLSLARAADPKKTEQLQAKYNPPEKKPNLFAALPGYGGPNGLTPDGEKPLTKQEAGRQALQEVSERHPILNALLAASPR